LVWKSRGSPAGWAVFKRKQGLESVLYFSPNARSLAGDLGAIECQAPPDDGLTLLRAGDPNARSLLG
jgi:hypothetical protein